MPNRQQPKASIMKCIIVDDEPLAIEIMESYVSKVDQLKLAGTFRNAVSAFTFLQQNQVDLIFLDIQMPKLSGIDFLKTLKNPPKVIFTTAFRDYALDGFELEVADYLLKPIPFDRFLKAVAKVLHQPNGGSQSQTVKTDTSDNYVYFKVDKKDGQNTHGGYSLHRKYQGLCEGAHKRKRDHNSTKDQLPGRELAEGTIFTNTPVLYCKSR